MFCAHFFAGTFAISQDGNLLKLSYCGRAQTRSISACVSTHWVLRRPRVHGMHLSSALTAAKLA